MFGDKPCVADFIFGLSVIVRDEEKALKSVCTCHKFNGKDRCWVKGIIGMLGKDEMEKYCPENKRVYKDVRYFDKLKEFFDFSEMLCRDVKFPEKLKCMSDVFESLKELYEKKKELAKMEE